MDITKCTGQRDTLICAMRESCYRHKAPDRVKPSQTYFMGMPLIVRNGFHKCEFHWPMAEEGEE